MARARGRLTVLGILVLHAGIYFCLGFFSVLIETLVEQPKPEWYEGGATWLSLTIQGATVFGAMAAAAATLAIAFNQLRLKLFGNPARLDCAYYPRWYRLRRVSLHARSTYALIAIGAPVVYYWSWCIYENVLHRIYLPMHGWFWPPAVVQMTILAAWGALWFAEILTRPNRQVMPVCLAYWGCLLLIWGPLGCSYVIE